uniref:Putative phospholipase n=1 Tax=Lutzomyia longipalpis TaxID=7200 RepID=A0A1B0FV22_LUTLO
MGDSYTAGAAGMSTRIEHILLENRGVASPIGGQATWRQFFTIPNILKVYNPNLFGYSFTDASSFQRISRFNVAESGAMSRDMPYQAWNLIKRMRSNPNVNITKHWKMVFYWIGTNDFCSDMCYLDDPSVVIEKHARELAETLRILRDNLPRTMVNVIASPQTF